MGSLVGRDEELGVLRRALAGHGSATLVHGEAGVGKTALVREVLADVDHRAGGALGTLSWLPYLSLRRAFPQLPEETWTGDVAWVLARVAPALGDAVLLVEDLHWADAATLEVLDQLVGRARLVMTVRRGDPVAEGVLSRLEKAGAERLDVDPLAPWAAAELALALRPGLAEWQVEALLDRSGGNPLLVEELSRDGGESASLRLSLLARCRQLPDSQLEGLALLALAARPLPVDSIDAAGLADSGLVGVDEAGDLTIRHALIGEVIGDLLSEERRVRCHRTLARLLTHPGDVARHLLAAGDLAAAHRAALRAVDRSATLGERWRHLVTAAESSTGEGATELRVRAAEAAVQAAELDAAAELVEQLPVPAGLRARALRVQASVAFQDGDWQRFDRLLVEATDVAPDGSAVQAELLALTASKVLLVDNSAERAYDLATSALRLAEHRGHPTGEAAVVAGTAAWSTGRGSWRELLEVAAAEGRARQDAYLEASAALNVFNGHLVNAEVEEARRHAAAMADRFRALRLARWSSCFESCLLSAALYRTDLPYIVAEAGRLAHVPLRPLDHFDNVAVLGTAHAEMGSFADAMECVDQLAGLEVFRPNRHLLTALAHQYAGQPDRALLEREAFEAVGPSPILTAEAAVVWAWAAFEAGAAQGPRPDLTAMPLMAGAPREVEAWRALSADEHGTARELFLEAAELHGPRRGHALRCTWGAAEARRLAGGSAEDQLVEVRHEAERLALGPVVARCERSLRALGVRLPHAKGPATDPLTRRERQVVDLVVEGSTDREIAARLGLAHRTVQTQLASARRKLGADNRAHLVALVGGDR